MGFRSLGLGFESEKKPKREWDWCFDSISVGSGHWLVGFGKNGLLENGIGNPPSGPSIHTEEAVEMLTICGKEKEKKGNTCIMRKT